jgi:hypothetical protein
MAPNDSLFRNARKGLAPKPNPGIFRASSDGCYRLAQKAGKPLIAKQNPGHAPTIRG